MQATSKEPRRDETSEGAGSRPSLAAAVILSIAVAGCGGDATSPPPAVPLAISTTLSGRAVPASVGPDGTPEVSASSADRSLGARADARGSVSVTDPEGNELTVDLAVLLVEQIRLHPRGAGSCGDGETCERAEGALLLRVPLDGSVRSRGPVAQLDATVYDEIQFRLRPGGASDSAVVDSFPQLEGASILVEGSYNGEDFTFTSDASTQVSIAISPTLDLTSSPSAANVTLAAPVSSWFLAEDQTLIDPTGGPASGVVAENIAASFSAFPDLDADGQPDTSGPFGGS